MKLNFQKLDIEIPVEIPVNFMISTGTGIPANRLILTGTGILPGSRSILESHSCTNSKNSDFLTSSHVGSINSSQIAPHLSNTLALSQTLSLPLQEFLKALSWVPSFSSYMLTICPLHLSLTLLSLLLTQQQRHTHSNLTEQPIICNHSSTPSHLGLTPGKSLFTLRKAASCHISTQLNHIIMISYHTAHREHPTSYTAV